MYFELSDLRIFCAIAEAPSLTQGAKKVFLSPAAASARIKKLEGQFKSRLFYRHNKGLDLTPAGKRLLMQANILLRQSEQIKEGFIEQQSDKVGHVRVYANTTATTDVMPNVLARFLSERPRVSIDLQEQLTKDIVRGVLEGTADLGILSGPVHNDQLQRIHFSTDRLAVIAPSHHALCAHEKVTFEDTLAYPQIGLHQGSTLRNFLSELQAQMGVSIQTRVHVSGFESVSRLVEAGVGIAIVPECSVRRHRQVMAITQLYLNEPWAIRERSIIVKDISALNNVAQALINQIVEMHRDFHG